MVASGSARRDERPGSLVTQMPTGVLDTPERPPTESHSRFATSRRVTVSERGALRRLRRGARYLPAEMSARGSVGGPTSVTLPALSLRAVVVGEDRTAGALGGGTARPCPLDLSGHLRPADLILEVADLPDARADEFPGRDGGARRRLLDCRSIVRSAKRLDEAERLGAVREAPVELKRSFVGRRDVQAQHGESALTCPGFPRLHQRPADAPAPRTLRRRPDPQRGLVRRPATSLLTFSEMNPSGVPSSSSAIKTVDCRS